MKITLYEMLSLMIANNACLISLFTLILMLTKKDPTNS